MGESVIAEITTDGCAGTPAEVRYLEHVQARVSLRFLPRGNINIQLVSPSGNVAHWWCLCGPEPTPFLSSSVLYWCSGSILALNSRKSIFDTDPVENNVIWKLQCSYMQYVLSLWPSRDYYCTVLILVINLKNISGTTSTLLFERPRDVFSEKFDDWPFLSVHFWGEKAVGRWRLVVTNAGTRQVHKPGLFLSIYQLDNESQYITCEYFMSQSE